MAADEKTPANPEQAETTSEAPPGEAEKTKGAVNEEGEEAEADDSEDEEEAPTSEPASAASAASSSASDGASRNQNKKKKPAAARLPLPPRVEQALHAARAAAKADRERKGGRWLAIFPASIGLIILALMMPRAAPPDGIPAPRVNQRALDATMHADDARASSAEAERLPDPILALGSAIREANRSEVRGDDVERLDARRRLDSVVRMLPKRATIPDELATLRAVQLRHFLISVAHWEATGQSTEELVDLGGTFITRVQDAGWISGKRVLLTDAQRRVAFKLVWNVLVGVDSIPSLAVTLDEQRALYAFYIEHPHPPEAHRVGLEAQRSAAKTPEECARANAESTRQSEMWLADKIKKLSAIDDTYPGAYALGVVYYRVGRFDLSAEAFNAYVVKHPDGPFALRAKNHLKAALAEGL